MPLPPPLPPARPFRLATEQLDQLLRRAREKTEVARWIPKPLRGLFRRQGSYNRILLDVLGAVLGTNADFSERLRELREGIESQNKWLRQAGGLPALQEIASIQVQLARLREHSNWLGREVNSLREAAEANAAGTRAVAETLRSVDIEVLRGAVLHQGTLLDEARQRLGAIGGIAAELEQISTHFKATPYLANPEMLRTTDDDGRETIGYRTPARSSDADESYLAFENIFRGSEELVRRRQRTYLSDLRGHEPIVDLGCGRGEMLDLLDEANIAASGVDSDAGMVRHTRGKGHRVEQVDVIEYLAAQADGSLGGLFSAQVIEHLSGEQLLRLLTLAMAKLKPGGILIAETVNPHSHRALKTFYVDLTHNKPIFPEVLVVLCRQIGFAEAIIRFPCGEGTLERDRLSEGEYAIIARKAARSVEPAA